MNKWKKSISDDVKGTKQILYRINIRIYSV